MMNFVRPEIHNELYSFYRFKGQSREYRNRQNFVFFTWGYNSMKAPLLTAILALFAFQTAPQNNAQNNNAATSAVVQEMVTRSETATGIPDVQITVVAIPTQAPGAPVVPGTPAPPPLAR